MKGAPHADAFTLVPEPRTATGLQVTVDGVTYLLDRASDDELGAMPPAHQVVALALADYVAARLRADDATAQLRGRRTLDERELAVRNRETAVARGERELARAAQTSGPPDPGSARAHQDIGGAL